ncbi:hypothetical protein F5Y19DRAFT_340057 [Xylariaceae sp. FL1651]|nr:hypothetical protein F5Y19DRAFT_340057 [Xylariaceae sp. FL1651]
MDFRSATTRLRRTFAYPSDTTTTSPSSSHFGDDDDDAANGPALDEQEQEELIRALAHQNATRNAQFRLFLLALPALSTIPYLLLLFGSLSGLAAGGGGGGEGGGGDRRKRSPVDLWTALLALSSLACTAWTLWSLPPGVTGIRALDTWVGGASSNPNPNSNSSGYKNNNIDSSRGDGTGEYAGGYSSALGPIGANAQRRRRLSSTSNNTHFFWAQARSPLEQYLPFLNIGLCGVLVLTGILSSQRSAAAVHWGHVGLANLPAVVYAVVLVAKAVMGGVDPERELTALRYEYKGA